MNSAPIDIAWQWIFSGRLDEEATWTARELFHDDSYFETMELTVIHMIVLDVMSYKKNLEEELQVSTADINVVDRTGRSPLAWAAIRGDVASLTILLSNGAQTWLPDKSGNHPIHHAATNESAGCVQILLNYGAARDAQNAVGQTPLHVAAAGNKLECMRVLLGPDTDAESSNACVGVSQSQVVNAGDHEMETPLMYAARNEHVDAATVLLDNGANINARTIWGLTAADLCVRYNCHRMLDFLLFGQANHRHETYDYTSRDIHGREILHQAARDGNTAVIKVLLRVHKMDKALLDINHEDCFGKTAMDGEDSHGLRIGEGASADL